MRKVEEGVKSVVMGVGQGRVGWANIDGGEEGQMVKRWCHSGKVNGRSCGERRQR